MPKFDFITVPRTLFGRGQFSRLGEIAGGLGTRAAIVFNGDEGLARRTMETLSATGRESILIRQKGEPTINDIDSGVEAARSAGADFVIGLGGGSAIDAAKAIAGLLTNGGAAIDYMEVIGKGRKITINSAPWIAIPTTAGTGAEATRNAVVNAPEHHFKASIRGEQLMPRVAIIDPELAVGVPPHVTAQSGMDALCQLIESYTSTGAQPITDALALQGIALAATALPRAFRDGSDIQAREDMALAAYLSGVALTNAGLGAVHGFAAPLGANFPAPHGAVCAALLPHVIAGNVYALRASGSNDAVLDRYVQIGRLLGHEASLEALPAIEAAERCTTELALDLRIPPLSKFGINDSDIPAMVQLARKASSMRFNPIELSEESLAKILQKAIAGSLA